jgi:hypothetical protein
MSLCQKCKKLPATHRVRITVDEERSMRPAPSVTETDFRGPAWSMDAATCGPCGAEIGMLIASQVLDRESN